MRRAKNLLVSLTVASLVSLAVVAQAAGQAYEPNDSFISGFGPITAGTTYAAGTETDNDEDYYFFYVSQRTQMFFKLTAIATEHEDSRVCAEVTQQTNQGYATVDDTYLDVYEGEEQTAAVTLDRGKYFFTVLDYCSEAGETYTFRIDPPGATSTYEPFAAECAAAAEPVQAASDRVDAARAAVAKAKRKLSRARARRAKRSKLRARKRQLRAVRAELRAAEAAFKAAAADQRGACSVPQ